MTVESGGSGAPMSERMQSLLSRAVEDQLSEQRQIAGVLADLRAQLQQIAGDVAAVRQDTHTGGSSDAALSTVSADVREAVRLLGERLDGVARLVQQRGNDLAELRGLVEQVQTAVHAHGDALGALHERLAGLDSVNSGVGALQQRVDNVDQGLRELRSAFAAVGARMAELPGRADLDAAAQRSFAGLDERLAGLEQAVAAVSAQVSAATERAQEADGAEDGADEVGELRAELSRFAATAREETHGLTQRLAALDHRLSEVLEAVTPADAAEAEDAAGDDDDDAEDPVLTELADLREALLGEDGLAARVEAVGAEDLDARVGAAVQQAVAASEERLAAHVDEAVFALAEALLRRRGRPSAPATGGAPTPAETPADPSPAAEVAPAATPTPEDDEEPDAALEDAPEVPTPSAPAWQTPGTRDQPAASRAATEAERRRRPWWRPGD